MTIRKPEKLMSRLLVTALVVFFIGEIFKIQHYPYGSLLSFIGLGSYIIMSLIEIDRLNKVISKSNSDKRSGIETDSNN